MTAEKKDQSTKKVSIARRHLLMGAAGAPLLLTLNAKNLLASLDDHTAQSAIGAPFSGVLVASNGTSALENELYQRIVTTGDSDLTSYYGKPGTTYDVLVPGDGSAIFVWYSDASDSTIPFTLTYEQNHITNTTYSISNATVSQGTDPDNAMAYVMIVPDNGYTLKYNGTDDITQDEGVTGTLAGFDTLINTVEGV